VPDERLHPRAQEFSKAASVYEGARPAFPVAAIEWLCRELRITGTTRVLDLGAGTGRLTVPLHERTRAIVAVEPVPEMRAVLQAALPEIEVLDGTAEQIPLADASVGAVVVAQAFHWFDAKPALAEIARVLEPEGRLGLVWHSPDRSDPLQRAYRAIVEQNRQGAPLHLVHDASHYVGEDAPLARIAAEDIRDVHEYDADRLVALARSTSHFAALDEAQQAVGERAIRALAGSSGTVELPYVVELSAFARTERQAATTSH
jgi:ubiquinone/menaquinone biosynthesis C-methylase UbiE